MYEDNSHEKKTYTSTAKTKVAGQVEAKVEPTKMWSDESHQIGRADTIGSGFSIGIRGPDLWTNLLQGVPSSAQTAVSRAIKSPWMRSDEKEHEAWHLS